MLLRQASMGESKDDMSSEGVGADSRAAPPAVDPALRFADCPPLARSFIDVCLEPNADARTLSVEELLRHPWIETCGPKEEMRADVLRHLADKHVADRWSEPPQGQKPETVIFSAAAVPPHGRNVPAGAGEAKTEDEEERIRHEISRTPLDDVECSRLVAPETLVFEPLVEAAAAAAATLAKAEGTSADAAKKELDAATATLEEDAGLLSGPWKLATFIASGGEGQAYGMQRVSSRGGGKCVTANEKLVLKIYWDAKHKVPGQDQETVFYKTHMDLFEQGHYPGTGLDNHVIRVHSVVRKSVLFGGCSYVIMEYAENGDLWNFWKQRPMDQNAVRYIVREILHGLRVLHSTPNDGSIIAHRDLKSENVLLFANGDIKIMDFGHAKGFGNRGKGASMLTALQGDPWLSRLALMVLQQCPGANDGGRMIQLLKAGGWQADLPDPNTCVHILRQHAGGVQGKGARTRVVVKGLRGCYCFVSLVVVLIPPLSPPPHPQHRQWCCGSWRWCLRRRRPHTRENGHNEQQSR